MKLIALLPAQWGGGLTARTVLSLGALRDSLMHGLRRRASLNRIGGHFGRLDHIHNVGYIIHSAILRQWILSNLGYFTERGSMTPAQSRAARGWLGWSQRDLAKRANVALNTVNEFEAGRRNPTPNNIAALRRAIEAEGIRLLFDDVGAPAGIARQDARIDLFTNGQRT
jgi:DNA-binding transcriptional regulator YiaG